jgi:hypothetical protein
VVPALGQVVERTASRLTAEQRSAFVQACSEAAWKTDVADVEVVAAVEVVVAVEVVAVVEAVVVGIVAAVVVIAAAVVVGIVAVVETADGVAVDVFLLAAVVDAQSFVFAVACVVADTPCTVFVAARALDTAATAEWCCSRSEA